MSNACPHGKWTTEDCADCGRFIAECHCDNGNCQLPHEVTKKEWEVEFDKNYPDRITLGKSLIGVYAREHLKTFISKLLKEERETIRKDLQEHIHKDYYGSEFRDYINSYFEK